MKLALKRFTSALVATCLTTGTVFVSVNAADYTSQNLSGLSLTVSATDTTKTSTWIFNTEDPADTKDDSGNVTVNGVEDVKYYGGDSFEGIILTDYSESQNATKSWHSGNKLALSKVMGMKVPVSEGCTGGTIKVTCTGANDARFLTLGDNKNRTIPYAKGEQSFAFTADDITNGYLEFKNTSSNGDYKMSQIVLEENISAAADTSESTTVAESSSETTTVTEASTETTTKAVETSTKAVENSTEVTTQEADPAVNDGVVLKAVPRPSTAQVGDQIVVDYVLEGNDKSKGFNNYTLFLDFDPTLVKPVSVQDGNITLSNGMVYSASDASEIENQLSNVPEAGNSDFDGADGTKTQAELGRIKVAYVIDSQACNDDGALLSFTDDGILFTVVFEAVGNGSTAFGTSAVNDEFEVVSSDSTIAKSVPVAADSTGVVDIVDTSAFKFGGAEEEYKAVAGDEVEVSFKTEGNVGWDAYSIFVDYDPEQLEAVAGSATSTRNGVADMINGQISYVPKAANPDYVNADGVKTCAQLGTLKLAYVNTTDSAVETVKDDATEFTIKFKVLKTPAEGERFPIYVNGFEDGFYTVGGSVTPQYTDAYIVAGEESSSTTETSTETTTAETSTETTTQATESTTKAEESSTQATTEVVTKKESSTEATTEATTEAASQATTEVVTKEEPSTEATTAEATTQKTETTTRRRSTSGGGGGGGGSKGTIITTNSPTETTTTKSDDNTGKPTTTKPSDKNVITYNNDGSVSIVTPDGTSVRVKIPTEVVNPDVRFTDLGNYSWAEDAINNLASLGIVNGTSDDTYSPSLPCKRGDFAVLIHKSLGLDVTATKNFDDNYEGKYYYDYVREGYTAGILSGYGDNNYKPENYCTREEMFVLTAKTLEYLGVDVTSTDESVLDKYADVDAISWWSAPYCAFLTSVGIVNGTAAGNVEPDRYINRAEMAVMMYEDYKYTVNYIDELGLKAAAAAKAAEEAKKAEEETAAETKAEGSSEATTESASQATTEAATEATTRAKSVVKSH